MIAHVAWTQEDDGAFTARVWWGVDRCADLVVTRYVDEGWCVKVDVSNAPHASPRRAPRVWSHATGLPSSAAARTLAERLVAAVMEVMP